jgi:hypothetical protein
LERYEFSVRQNGMMRALLVAAAGVAVYFAFFRKLPFEMWVLLGAVLVVLPFRMLKGVPSGARVVLDGEGVCDRRLKLGVIRWEDIKSASLRESNNVPFICLELKNPAAYRARMNAAQRLTSSLYRLMRMKHVVISASHLDVDARALLARIQAGCAGAREAA